MRIIGPMPFSKKIGVCLGCNVVNKNCEKKRARFFFTFTPSPLNQRFLSLGWVCVFVHKAQLFLLPFLKELGTSSWRSSSLNHPMQYWLKIIFAEKPCFFPLENPATSSFVNQPTVHSGRVRRGRVCAFCFWPWCYMSCALCHVSHVKWHVTYDKYFLLLFLFNFVVVDFLLLVRLSAHVKRFSVSRLQVFVMLFFLHWE